MCKSISTHPIKTAFWGLGAVDIHEKLMHETLHNNHLGVSPALIRMYAAYISAHVPNGKKRQAVFSKMSSTLLNFPRLVPGQLVDMFYTVS